MASPNPWRRRDHLRCRRWSIRGLSALSGLMNVQLEHFNLISDDELEPIAGIGIKKVGAEKILCDRTASL
jgi:hypothetical protein